MTPKNEESVSPTNKIVPATAVTLVIPGRNCAHTLKQCLHSVMPLLEDGQLHQIIFVNDGSTDNTESIAREFPVNIIRGSGEGPGAARNLGWRAATTELIWFMDSDCVAKPDALSKLLPHLASPSVAGVGGSYDNLYPDSLLAALIHEEIASRHLRMPTSVNFLATFNVVYRRNVLAEVSGFDESLTLAQDADLAFRIVGKGHQLSFEICSRVGHHHPRQWSSYMRTQRRQGCYRMLLYRRHPGRVRGDSYAGLVDYVQPPLAVVSWPLFSAGLWSTPALIAGLLIQMVLMLLQLPWVRLTVRTLRIRAVCFLPFGWLRAHYRGMGMVSGLLLGLLEQPPGGVPSQNLTSQEAAP